MKKKEDQRAGYCYQHRAQAAEEAVGATLREDLPSTVQVTRKVETVLRRGPSKADAEGWLYVYYLRSDDREERTYYKVGRTQQTRVETRIKQWPGAVLKGAFRVRWNRMAERLVHLLLGERRVYRYPYTKETKRGPPTTRYHTIRQHDGSPVRDTQCRQDDIDEGTWKLSAQGKQVEWFACDYRTCKRVMEAVQRYVETVEKK